MNELKQETFIDKQELADFMLTQYWLRLIRTSPIMIVQNDKWEYYSVQLHEDSEGVRVQEIEQYSTRIIKMMPKQAKILAAKYGIMPIEVTRLTQVRNLDRINGTKLLEKKLRQVCRIIYANGENVEYWKSRRKFIEDYFLI